MNEHTEQDINFEEAIENIQKVTTGELVKAQIVTVSSEGVIVNLGLKSEGLIPISEFGQRGIPEEFKPGTEVPVVVKSETQDGFKTVSYTLARQKSAWSSVLYAYKNAKPINCKIVKKIKGGYIVDIGVDAFLPGSQLDTKVLNHKDEFLNTSINVLITELNNKDKSAVVSHRKFIEIEKKKNAEKIFNSLKPDDIVEGTITGTTDFGAFVDIGGVEGLIHISDLSWLRVKKTTDIVRVGEKIKTKVLKVDKEKNKISLGLKQLSKHPWEDVDKKYPVGSTVKGKITSIMNFGAFVELEPGVEGLLHISELSWTNKAEDPKKLLKIGDELELKVTETNINEEKLSLSLKRMQPNPWEKLKNEFPSGTKIKCTVEELVPFGAFVSLPFGLVGLLHIEDMSWMKKIRNPKKILKVGEQIDAVLLNVKPEIEKASVSIKHLTEDPFEKYSVGKTIKGKITKVLEYGAYVNLEKGVDAFLKKSEIAFEKDRQPDEVLKPGQDIEAKVVKSDRTTKRIDISIKRLEHDRERELIKKYSDVEMPHLSEILEEK